MLTEWINTYILPNEIIDTNFVFVVYFEFNIKNCLITFGWVISNEIKITFKSLKYRFIIITAYFLKIRKNNFINFYSARTRNYDFQIIFEIYKLLRDSN